MRTSIECLECLSHSFTKVVKKLITNEEQGYEITCRIAEAIGANYRSRESADIGTIINKIIMEYFDDPFKKEKNESRKVALKIFDAIKYVEINLETAVKIALYGNLMDYTVKGLDPRNIDIDINSILKIDIAVNHIDYLEKELNKASTVLYLTDNAGEVILDYFLIKYIKSKGLKVILAPKEAPIQNDATVEDIEGTPILDIVDEVIPTAQAVGLDLQNSSKKFKEIYNNADIIILKGMGYFENAYKFDKNSFFILKAKCSPVARELGVNTGNNVVLWRRYK